MKGPIYIKIPASQQGREGEIFRRLAQILLALSLFAGFFAGTFPFDFSIPPGGFLRSLATRWDWAFNPYDPGYVDRIENLFFLMPLGFSAAAFTQTLRPRWRNWLLILLGTAAAGASSLAIECSQTLISFRDPSFADVWCNTVGGVIGAAVFVSVGRSLLRFIAAKSARYVHYLTFRNRAILLGLYSIAQLVFPLLLHGSGELDVWNLGMPLIVGNELNAEHRWWSGLVADVSLADHAASAEQVAHIAKGTSVVDVLGTSVLAAYELTGAGPYADQAGHEKPLQWAGRSPGTFTAAGIVTSQDDWLRTNTPLFGAIKRIQRTSEFTFCTRAATLDPGQRIVPPLRVATISSGTTERNVTIGQDATDLVVRVRTAVAFMPDLYLHDIWADLYPHAIAVTAKHGLIVVYVDGIERGRCEITPEAKIIWRLYPRGAFRLYIDRYGDRSYALIYRLLVMLPFALLLALAMKRWTAAIKQKRLAIVETTAAMTTAIEAVLWIQGGHLPNGWNALVSFAIGLTAMLVTLPGQTRRSS